MNFLGDYGLFILKLLSSLAIIVLFIGSAAAIIGRSKEKMTGKFSIKKLNEQYDNYREVIQEETLDKKALKSAYKQQKLIKKSAKKDNRPRLFVLNFKGDIKALSVEALREEITALLLSAQKNDIVLLRLESGGGLVNAYGLAAAQLQRIRSAQLKLVVAIDKIAASGGYMMACVANEIIAAPFAIIGSIGVLAQIPNFHRLLQKNAIDFEQLSAGQYKRTLTLFGKNTEEGREKLQEEINDTHELFKQFIQQNRHQVPIEQVSTGEYWHAIKAIEWKLIDHLMTSDDYLLKQHTEYDCYEIKYQIKQPLSKRITQGVYTVYENLTSHFY